jgi:pectate lyase
MNTSVRECQECAFLRGFSKTTLSGAKALTAADAGVTLARASAYLGPEEQDMRVRPIVAAVIAPALVIGGAAAAPARAAAPAAPSRAGAPDRAAAAAASDRAAADHLGADLRVARQVLPPNDGWAAADGGTTGGAAADPAHIAVAGNRAELIAAVAGDTPKIVLVRGRIDMTAGATCADFADPGYTLDAFLAAYDPAVWGRTSKPTGPLEEARVRSAQRQGEQIKITVGSNTTIVGLPGARIDHGSLVLANVGNVIVRGVEFTDAADCFPAWDPTDGAAGNWNSLYDLVSLTGATHVWLDHDTFSDGGNDDADQPLYFGRPYQVHDGASDIIRGSDLVTVSYNDYSRHDKTMLIGSTDTPGADVGRLRVTVHHNRFGNVLQRAPRVRFGQVDVYDNLYVATSADYQYSLGVGVESSIYAQNNYFRLGAGVPAADVIHYWKGTRITAIGSLVQVDGDRARPVDLVAAYNAAYDPDLAPDAGWTPTLRTRLDPAALVPLIVTLTAGARGLHPGF